MCYVNVCVTLMHELFRLIPELCIVFQVAQWFNAPVVTVVRFVGTTTTSFDIRQLLLSICYQITETLSTDDVDPMCVIPQNYYDMETFFFRLLDEFPDHKNLVIILDSIHLLGAHHEAYVAFCSHTFIHLYFKC